MRVVDDLRKWLKLESRVSNLEQKIECVPGETCPKCGARSLRLYKMGRPVPKKDAYDIWRCIVDACDHIEKRITDRWAYIDGDPLIGSSYDYVVYLGPTGDINRETTASLDSILAKTVSKTSSIFSDGAALEARARRDLDKDTRRELLCLIGSAYVCCYESDIEGARNAIVAARQFLIERSEETSRYWYLSASFFVAIVFGLLGLLCWIYRSWVESVVGTTVLLLLLGSAAGAMGALLSVILRSGKLNVVSSAGRRLHVLEASSRIAAGALSGVIVCLAIKAGIVLGAVGSNPPRILVLLAAMAAGASERLATSIIAKIESADDKRRREKSK